MDGDAAAAIDLSGRFSLAGAIQRVGRVTHVLSHRRLTVDVHAGVLSKWPGRVQLPEVYEAADLFDDAAFEGLGFSTLARKILAAAAPGGDGPLFSRPEPGPGRTGRGRRP